MTDEQIARLESAIDAFFNTPNRQDVEVLKAAAAEYLRLLPYIKAVCEADDAVIQSRNYYAEPRATEMEILEAKTTLMARVVALIEAVKEGEK